jgi:hypothetical protein
MPLVGFQPAVGSATVTGGNRIAVTVEIKRCSQPLIENQSAII